MIGVVFRSAARAGLIAVAFSMVLGCATVQPLPSHRKGFFDRVSGQEIRKGENAALTQQARRKPAKQSDEETEQSTDSDKDSSIAKAQAAVEVSGVQLHWPLQQVQITSPFGRRGGEFHEGIDLRAKSGTLVFAAQEGTVIYVGSKIRGYGRLVVIRHSRGISTVYAHNSRLLVRSGQYVRQGQRIAISGNTGHSSGPHLHFEVRSGLTAVNPGSLMVRRKSAQVQANSKRSIVLASTARTVRPRPRPRH